MKISRTPDSRQTFEKTYARVPEEQSAALRAFRETHSPSTLEVDGVTWEYLSAGDGEAVLFLHGMAGAYDIWFQQFEALKEDFHLLGVTYPTIDNLAQMEAGVLAVLNKDGVTRFSVLGTSLGGYLAQYLVGRHPERIRKAVFANTFPPNELIAKQNAAIGRLLPYLPQWLVLRVMRGGYKSRIYPASGYDELTLAFLIETLERITKADIIGRYRCVVELFEAPDLSSGEIPVLIIEADNDPLVEGILRVGLKETYPQAEVVTVQTGHFSYLSSPEYYSDLLKDFLAN
jgi:pimeloyl-ACP methyl ester carboxylesterase